MRLFLKISAKPVGSQYLQGAEKYKMMQLAEKYSLSTGLYLQSASMYSSKSSFLKCQDIGLWPAIRKRRHHRRTGLCVHPEIDEPWFVIFNHYIPALEIAIHESG